MSHHAATAPGSSSLLTRLDESGFTNRHLTLYLTVLSGHFLCGFVINVTGVTLPGIISTFHLTSEQAGVYSSVLFAGMLVGAALAGSVSDRFGRRVPLAASIAIYAVFCLAAVFAWSFPSLLVFRGLQGIGLGAEIAVVLPYIAEFAPSRHRGPMITMATSAWLIGLPVAAAIGALVVPAFSWRAMFVVGTLPVLVSLFMLARLPESVRYLLRRGRPPGCAPDRRPALPGVARRHGRPHRRARRTARTRRIAAHPARALLPPLHRRALAHGGVRWGVPLRALRLAALRAGGPGHRPAQELRLHRDHHGGGCGGQRPGRPADQPDRPPGRARRVVPGQRAALLRVGHRVGSRRGGGARLARHLLRQRAGRSHALRLRQRAVPHGEPGHRASAGPPRCRRWAGS